MPRGLLRDTTGPEWETTRQAGSATLGLLCAECWFQIVQSANNVLYVFTYKSYTFCVNHNKIDM